MLPGNWPRVNLRLPRVVGDSETLRCTLRCDLCRWAEYTVPVPASPEQLESAAQWSYVHSKFCPLNRRN